MVVLRGSRVENELVAAAIRGDGLALDQVITAWLPTVYGWCARLGAARIDAEEAAHDVMMVLVRRHHTIAEPSRLPSWLFQVCRRTVANHSRRAWWRRWLPGVVLENRAAADRTDDHSDEQDLCERVAAALERLTVDHREVLVLCYLEDRSVAEASALLGIPPGTVKSRLFAARARFQSSFGEQE